MDLELNNHQSFICHKIQTNIIKQGFKQNINEFYSFF